MRLYLALVDDHLGEVSGGFVPLEGVSVDSADVYLTTEVAGQIAEVSALLDDGASAVSIE